MRPVVLGYACHRGPVEKFSLASCPKRDTRRVAQLYEEVRLEAEHARAEAETVRAVGRVRADEIATWLEALRRRAPGAPSGAGGRYVRQAYVSLALARDRERRKHERAARLHDRAARRHDAAADMYDREGDRSGARRERAAGVHERRAAEHDRQAARGTS
jgi:hypothetical protein